MQSTGSGVYVATLTTILSDSCIFMEEVLNHLKIFKLKDNTGEYVAKTCASILVDDYWLESAGACKPENLGYITHIFEENSD